eukprot:6203793-Prymnesium_polylepis.1
MFVNKEQLPARAPLAPPCALGLAGRGAGVAVDKKRNPVGREPSQGARGEPRGAWPLSSMPYRGEHASKSPKAKLGHPHFPLCV